MVTAAAFDMDGLMFDTERLSLDGWVHACRLMGLDGAEEYAYSVIGMNAADAERVFHGRYTDDYAAACRLCLNYMDNCIEENGMPLKPGLFDTLDYLKERGIKLAVATSTGRRRAMSYLESTGVAGYFDHFICGDQFSKGKPEPDIYIKACELLETEPGRCLAVEDSFAGITAAFRAGMKPVMVPDLLQPDDNIRRMTYAVVNNLCDIKRLPGISE